MDWYLLRYFLAVAELGNFSRAAGRMNVTQPTLSAGIAKLEAQLGHRLFDRDRRRVSLTQAGSRFLVHAQRIASDYEVALRDISQAEPRRTLRVGVVSTFATARLEAVVARHRAQPQAEELELLDGSERELKTWLDDERIELALTLLRPGTPAPAQERLYRERYVLVVSAQHRLAQERAVKGEELAKDAMIIRRHCEVLAATSQYFTQRGVRPSFGLKTTNDDKAMALVRAGLGVTVVPQSFTGPGICQIELIDFDLQREVGLVFSAKGRALAEGGCVFVETLRRELAEVR
ncbi:MAG: LysR family transcriptional regulator [Acidocella sp.]|nr:LysR family transcriptional regulator [Acidocella sp.]